MSKRRVSFHTVFTGFSQSFTGCSRTFHGFESQPLDKGLVKRALCESASSTSSVGLGSFHSLLSPQKLLAMESASDCRSPVPASRRTPAPAPPACPDLSFEMTGSSKLPALRHQLPKRRGVGCSNCCTARVFASNTGLPRCD